MLARDLLGEPIRPAAPKTSRAAKRPVPVAQVSVEAPAVCRCCISEDEIASFRELGVELCLSLDTACDVWVVPVYTNAPRTEISLGHVAILRRLMQAFPGTRITSFHRERAENVSQ
ncbi:MAG: hypothetical protein MJE77_23270 [Proteobacteria bacterium]|nr:hypothetical protein [Pseudomonadota bacterium]